ncbi:hypothetical protein EG329_007660 [Mollisiaceae sp. DMI_Dod_QoI]|nr:hypothetical protein EG329_007660 [Helotiales sp. DMI_Dod_QoI]
MATGFTEDDFVPLDELVEQLSNSCKAAASVFEDLSDDLQAIHRHLEHLIKQASNPDSLLIQRCQDRRKDWLHILESLTYALCELQEHISTYYEVGPDIWLQADDAQRQFDNLRSEVVVGYDAVDTFVDSLGLSPLGRKDFTLGQIEKLLVEAVREERAGTADYGVLRAYNGGYGGGGFSEISRYLKREGIDSAEIARHDARTKQLLIWVVDNEPALTDLMVHESMVTGNEKENVEATKDGKNEETEKIEDTAKSTESTENTTKVSPPSYEESRENEDDKKEDELEMTTVLVERHRPSTASRRSSVATSAPSLVETDPEDEESEWELV